MIRRRSRVSRRAVLPAVLGLLSMTARAQDGADPLGQAGFRGGLVVHLGCGDAGRLERLRAGPSVLVHGLDTDAEKVTAARADLLARGAYGPVSVDRYDGRRLPYADNLVNRLVADDPAGVPEAELLRVLAPRGVAWVRRDGVWRRVEKPWPEAMDEWTHYLHGADGNPVADDALVGPPKRLQWVGSPAWARHHDHMASMTALVSAGGRLFYIFDEGPTASIQLPSRWRLVARDAFNGTVLWKRDIGEWNTRQFPLKSGPAHLLRRLVAVGDRVFVTLGIDAPATALDAATGETVRTFDGSEHTREIVVSESVVFLVADGADSDLPAFRRVSTYVWENTRAANPGWGWKGDPRTILAYDAASGRRLWTASAPVAPCSLAADAARVVFQDGEKLVSLDRVTGKALWTGGPAPTKLPVATSTGPRVLLYQDLVLYAGNDGRMSGWSAKDGKRLWEQPHRPSGHASLQDLFVVQGLTWTGAIGNSSDDGTFIGYDPVTGEKKREFPADVKVHWFHHRCYPSKAAGSYLLTARNGTEYVDLEKQTWTPNHWVRGGCIYGVMPCNGLTYASMDACGCQLEAKLTGFNALAPGPLPKPSPADLAPEARLEKGPAYGGAEGPDAGPADWPTYRHDAARSGATPAAVPPEVRLGWEAKIGGRLSPPTAAAGMVFVAAVDAHTLHALDAGSGKTRWTFTAGGRIDSPPTYFKGQVLFGSTDGHVYALRATDGALAWRFRGAPIDRRVAAWEQLESAWPVHGSVLVHDGVLYGTAGRNLFLDGGIRFLRLDPASGRLLGEVVMDDRDPESGEEMHLAYLKKTPGNTMPVALSDILSCDGKQIWMRSQKFDLDGRRREIGPRPADEQPAEDCHLFCQVGFLDDSWFFRSYWTYGRRMTGGYGGWYQAGRYVPAGRILCVDDARVYGYGRKPEYMVNASVLEYQLFAADKAVSEEAMQHVRQAEREMNKRADQKNAGSSDWLLRHFYPSRDLTAARFAWTMDQPAVVVRAMAVAGGTLFVSGPPDVIDERQAYRLPDDPGVKASLQRQAEALEGRLGGQLWALAKADGKPLARVALDTIPVFDGMAVAAGRLYVSTADGRVLSLAAGGGTALKSLDDQPLRTAWEKPEDPGYLQPLPVSKEGDFARVARCSVTASELGYRLRCPETKQAGLAIKKLDTPLTGTVTLTTRIASPKGQDLLRNGYLAFGEGVQDDDLVKCGVRFQNRRAVITQGPLVGGKSTGAALEASGETPVRVVVKVDLSAGTVHLTADGATVEAKLLKPLKSITHVGYAVEGALADFAPVEVGKP